MFREPTIEELITVWKKCFTHYNQTAASPSHSDLRCMEHRLLISGLMLNRFQRYAPLHQFLVQSTTALSMSARSVNQTQVRAGLTMWLMPTLHLHTLLFTLERNFDAWKIFAILQFLRYLFSLSYI